MLLSSSMWNYEHICSLTKELDKLAGLDTTEYHDWFHHYIVADNYCKKHRCLAIRVPGGTVGSISYNEDNVITSISIDTDYVVKTYPDDLNEIISQKFVGQKIEGLD